VRHFEHGDDLVAMLQRRYAGTNPHFLWSQGFISTVKECQQQILSNNDKSYVYLSNLNATLKVMSEYRTLRKRSVIFRVCLVMIENI